MKRALIILLAVIVLSGSLPMRADSQTRGAEIRRRAVAMAATLPDGVAAKEVRFYSEGIQCYGKIFMPKGFSAESKVPAIALAPDWGETAPSIEKHAARFAA